MDTNIFWIAVSSIEQAHDVIERGFPKGLNPDVCLVLINMKNNEATVSKTGRSMTVASSHGFSAIFRLDSNGLPDQARDELINVHVMKPVKKALKRVTAPSG